ncbi:error-prone DNA polymerase [Achromobacter ruhlandii]|uniref:Error-prone DNA polymerase n=1 Tax=Achromobacter ruhlandii TaxID=72557 RepID=A0ABM8LZ44_9BURK|nr:error-prone DNA polymerase [Achromobacter ruhlandii]AKP90163.1 DNA polymerase III alpha subunit [Achromobacter xylosoxidans]AOU93386.1 DNA polymerase III subunit alpha [Achromobacter ruhlandii]MCZ8435296.1 error-prone DNA polymerase [Achromobacter ruhlandii]MDC6091056.1 error-prone DNA polymerase [Achromobacter ruhlandii]MDC6149988.1 error-prone DNA polymerase [Achromobacter ruhlandii]
MHAPDDPHDDAPGPPAGLPGYAELQCQSNFSFLQGASHPEELAARAAELGYAALAITDECSLAGVVRAHVEAKTQKLPLIIGATFRLRAGPEAAPLDLTLLAQTREGYGNLSELITLARTRAPKGEYRLAPEDFTAPPPGYEHLRHLPECLAILSPVYGDDPDRMAQQARWLAATFPRRAWVGLTLLYRSRDDLHRAAVDHAARAAELPVVALGQVQMHVRSRKPLHDTLTGIRTHQCVSQCGYALSGNAEQHLRTRMRLANLYPPEALAQTLVVARRCAFSLDELRYEYPDEIIPRGHTPATYLRQETLAGAARRFPGGTPAHVSEQIEKELALIADLHYEAYFLTVYDIVLYARNNGILCQGRGSAANSAVCYCLGITEVDPRRGNNLFERFISKERNEPPDIDVDFEHQRREEVIQYIYRKYGRQRAALTAVVISYRPRSVLRDTGRALGVDPGVIDAVARAHQWWDGKKEMLRTLGDCGLDPESQVARQWAALAQTLMGFPRHLSQHPGGFVISRGKLSRLVPIENAAMADRSVVQWDKDDLDALKLLKVDVLALGMLSALRRTLELAGQRRGQPLRLQDIPEGDEPTYDMICEADTIGVFQIESRAQMTMLPRLRPREYYDLVVQVAIVRPGPIQGGMVHPYLRRRQGKEKESYPSEKVRGVLSRTMGVPIFQEQVMQIAVVAAGFSPGDADQLRRSMAAWRRKGGVDKYRVKLVGGLLAHGYTLEFAEALFRQVEGFGEYGFPESHAASFALLAYASSWLKRHEPEAFLAALLNSQPMGFYAPAQLVQDARRHGVRVLPVDVTVSGWDAALEPAPADAAPRRPHPHAPSPDEIRPAVRLGLSLIQGLHEDSARRIEAARAEAPFTSTGDLARRAALTRHDLNALAAGDALRTLAGHRRQASWEAAASVHSRDLLRDAAIHETEMPQLTAPTENQTVAADYRSVGLTLRRHPVELLRPQLAARNFQPASVLNGYPDKRVARACGIVTVRQRPQTSKGVIFVTLEDETGPVNVVVRPELIERQRRELLGATLLGVYGSWQNVDGVRHLIAQRLVDLSELLGGLSTPSRNFH